MQHSTMHYPIREILLRISPQYQSVSREVLRSLDPKLEYQFFITDNKSSFRTRLRDLSGNYRGYENIHNIVSLITGRVSPAPRVAILSKFAIIAVKHILVHPHSGEVIRDSHILVYEEELKLGAVVDERIYG